MKLLFTYCIALLCIFHSHAQIGALDPTFGNGGTITHDLGGDDRSTSTHTLSDGKILVAGYRRVAELEVVLMRLMPDGSADSTFGTNGQVVTPLGSGPDQAFDMAVQANGKILLAGTGSDGLSMNGNFLVLRYNADGSMDPGFGTGGAVTHSFHTASNFGFNNGMAIALQSDGKIVLGGGASDGTSTYQYYPTVGRLNADGSLDTSFGTNGFTQYTFPGGQGGIGNDVKLLSDGSILLSGWAAGVGSSHDFGLVKFDANGGPDMSFGSQGSKIYDFGPVFDRAFEVEVQSDGKLLLSGFTASSLNSDGIMAVIRLLPNGDEDATYGSFGRVMYTLDGDWTEAYGSDIQADDKLLVGGLTSLNGTEYLFLSRLLTDGSMDTTFGTGGTTKVNITDANMYSTDFSLAIQPDGKILLSGSIAQNADWILARFLISNITSQTEANPSLGSPQLFPNPVRDKAVLDFELARKSKVSMDLYDMKGELVQTVLGATTLPPGKHREVIQPDERLVSGIYFLRVEVEGATHTLKLYLSR